MFATTLSLFSLKNALNGIGKIGRFISPSEVEQQIWHSFNQIERIQTRYGQKIVMRLDNGDLLTLPSRYGVLSEAQLQEINNTSGPKQFKIMEKKELPNGSFTYIYEFSNQW